MKKSKYLIVFILFTGLIILSSCSKSPDIIYVNGKIHTMDNQNSVVEALAVKDGRIIQTGTTAEITSKYESAERIDLEGKTVIPGLTDAEGSLVNYALNLSNIYLEKFTSREELKNSIKEKTGKFPPGTWIKIYYYGNDESTDDSLIKIDKVFLDEAAPEHNVYILNYTGTLAICNSKMLETLKINSETQPPENGDIAVYENDEIAGLLFGEAVKLINEKQRTISREDMAKYLELTSNEIVKFGITGVRDKTLNKESINIIRNLIDSNKFPLSLYVLISYEETDLFNEYITKGIEENYKDKLTIRGVSLDVDGSFEFSLSEMSEAYKNENKNYFSFNSENEVDDFIKKAFDKGFQVNIKAVGDKAITMTLNVIGKNLQNKNQGDHRTVLEHLQFVQKQDIAKFKEYQIIPSIRPEIHIDDISILNALTNERFSEITGLWKSLMDNSGRIITGSDFPFPNRTIIPFVQMYYMVTRKGFDPQNSAINNPDQKLTITDAVKAYTIWAAYANFDEEDRGSIEKDKFCDMVVLSEDIFGMENSPEKLLTIEVLKTIVSGKVIYNSSEKK